MSITLVSAHSPRFTNATNTAIILTCLWSHQAGEMEFNAQPTDTMAHGRDVFARAVTGEFGPVAAYSPTVEELSEEVKKQRQVTFKDAVQADSDLQAFKAMDKQAFDIWWSANVTNAAQAIQVLKKLAWLQVKDL